jgi:transcriptional regulator with XRE-family HTH domain
LAVTLTPEQIEQLVKTRQDGHLTQLELSDRSKVALRTIKDLEAGRRASFNESTLISLCRELSLSYADLIGPKSASIQKRRFPVWTFVLLAVLLLILALVVFRMRPKPNPEKPVVKRKDWILPEHIGEFPLCGENIFAGDPRAGFNGRQYTINYIRMKRLMKPNEIIPVAFKWNWKFAADSDPVVYISAITEWKPDNEIPIFNGTLQGSGSDSTQFEFTAPPDTGNYKIRFFWASAYGPISSFYGSPPPGSMEHPGSAPCCEMTIEVKN